MLGRLAEGRLGDAPAFEPKRYGGLVFVGARPHQHGALFLGVGDEGAPPAPFEVSYIQEPGTWLDLPDFWGGQRVARVVFATPELEVARRAIDFWASPERLRTGHAAA